MPPEIFVGLGTHLSLRGWADDEIGAVLGANVARVARRTWPRATSG